jgi:hypothetical protein
VQEPQQSAAPGERAHCPRRPVRPRSEGSSRPRRAHTAYPTPRAARTGSEAPGLDQLRHLHDHGGEHRCIGRDRDQHYYGRTIRQEFVLLPCPLGQKKVIDNEKGTSETRTYNRATSAASSRS